MGSKFGINSWNGGFSLVEIMIVGGIASIMAAGMATMFTQMNRQQKIFYQKQDMLSLRNIVDMALANPANCAAILGGQPYSKSAVSGAPVLASAVTVNGITIGRNTPYIPGGFSTDVVLQNKTAADDAVALGSPLTVEMRIRANPLNATSVRPVIREAVVPLQVVSTTANIISKCQSTSSAESVAIARSLCTQLGGTWDDVLNSCKCTPGTIRFVSAQACSLYLAASSTHACSVYAGALACPPDSNVDYYQKICPCTVDKCQADGNWLTGQTITRSGPLRAGTAAANGDDVPCP